MGVTKNEQRLGVPSNENMTTVLRVATAIYGIVSFSYKHLPYYELSATDSQQWRVYQFGNRVVGFHLIAANK
jgi:hypothetical protein